MKLTKTIEADGERVTATVDDPTVIVGDGRDEVLLGILNTVLGIEQSIRLRGNPQENGQHER